MRRDGDSLLRTVDSAVLPRVLGALALAGVFAFAAMAAASQWLRPDLDPRRATLSFYLLGPYGHWLVIAYWALAAALLMLGIGYRRTLRHVSGISLPAWLFAVGGIALALVTCYATDIRGAAPSLHGTLHNLSATAAFLCVGVAMLRLSWCLRQAPAWRRRAAVALPLAMLAFTGLWVDALWRTLPRGVAQKAVIALYLLWLGCAAWWLLRRPRYT